MGTLLLTPFHSETGNRPGAYVFGGEFGPDTRFYTIGEQSEPGYAMVNKPYALAITGESSFGAFVNQIQVGEFGALPIPLVYTSFIYGNLQLLVCNDERTIWTPAGPKLTRFNRAMFERTVIERQHGAGLKW